MKETSAFLLLETESEIFFLSTYTKDYIVFKLTLSTFSCLNKSYSQQLNLHLLGIVQTQTGNEHS